MVDGAGGPVAGQQGLVEGGREGGLGDPERARAGAAAVVGEGRRGLLGEVLVQAGIAVVGERGEVVEARVPALAVVGVVPGEQVEGGRDRDVAVVAGHLGVDLELGAVRTDAHDAAAVERDALAVAGADRAVVVAHESRAEVADGDVQPAVDAHAAAVGGVVGAAGMLDAAAESVDEQLALLGLAVAVLVAEHAEEGRMDEVEGAVDDVAAARTVDAGVLDHGVHDAVEVPVLGHEDAAHVLDVAEGAVLVGGDVEVSVVGGRDGGGVELGLLGRAHVVADGESGGHGAGGGRKEEGTEMTEHGGGGVGRED